MRYCILMVFLFIALPVSAQNAADSQNTSQVQSGLVRNIAMKGFVLDDKNQFVKLFKPYRNKYLTASDLDMILKSLQEIYEQAGYQGLVSITYQVINKRLIFTVSLIR